MRLRLRGPHPCGVNGEEHERSSVVTPLAPLDADSVECIDRPRQTRARCERPASSDASFLSHLYRALPAVLVAVVGPTPTQHQHGLGDRTRLTLHTWLNKPRNRLLRRALATLCGA